MINDIFNPQLIAGEKIGVVLNENEYILFCKSTSLGYKLQVELEKDGKVIMDNGIKLK
jgi:hypothetical protein